MDSTTKMHQYTHYTRWTHSPDASIHTVYQVAGGLNSQDASIHTVYQVAGGLKSQYASIHTVYQVAGGLKSQDASIHTVKMHKYTQYIRWQVDSKSQEKTEANY